MRARSPRPSPTTRTTWSSWVSRTTIWRCARRGRRSSAAGSSWLPQARGAGRGGCGGRGGARDGAVVGELALPIAGLLSDAPVEEVASGLERLQELLRAQGFEI